MDHVYIALIWVHHWKGCIISVTLYVSFVSPCSVFAVFQSAILQNNINHVQETLVLKLPDWFAEHIKPTTMRRRSGHSRVEVDDIATRYSPEDGNVDVMRGLAESSLATVRRLVRSTELHMDDCIRTAFNVVSNTVRYLY